jgi:predicted nucleic acid-binding protein
MATFRLMPIDRYNTVRLWDRVWALSANLSVYDAQYVALSEALGVPLLTADQRIARSGTARCTIETMTHDTAGQKR